MVYLILADVVVAIHLAYVSYVVFGQLLIVIGILLKWQWIRNKWFRLTHLAMILVVAGESLSGITCPLTTWEYQLLEAAERPALPLMGASAVGLMGSPLEHAPFLTASALFPGRTEQLHEHRSFVGRLMANLMFCDCSDNLWVWPVSYCLMAAMVLVSLVVAPPRWRRGAQGSN